MSVYKFSPGSEIPQQELKYDLVCHNNRKKLEEYCNLRRH